MTRLFAETGPMWFLLAFGLATLVFATRYAWVPSRRTLRTTMALAAATAFTSLTCITADLASVGRHATAYVQAHPETPKTEVLLQGIAEAFSSGILAFTMLSLTAVIVALGLQRDQGT